MPTPLKVLIVENSENDALLIADCLGDAGYAVNWDRVETARELSHALAGTDTWDLILSDYTMPGFGGLEALKIYQASGLDIPFILVSGSIGEERAIEAMHAGVHDYIMKDHTQRLGPAIDRELREAANRRDRRVTADENLRLNSVLLELNEALRDKVELLSRSRADLEQVTWAASHDLKEPLRMVTTYTQMLLRRRARVDEEVDEEEVEFSRYITEGVARVTALIDGLLAYAQNLRTPVDRPLNTDADEVVKDVLETIGGVIQNRSAVITVEPLPAVRIEKAALADVFQQLFLNSLEYRRDGVMPRIEVSSSRHENEVCFAMRDNGIGIKAEHHARIFQLFRRLHGAEYPGIGLGLPLSKRLIENYGGRMWLESEPGVGSTFYFTLMAATSAASAVAK